jgi:hypothetical protein
MQITRVAQLTYDTDPSDLTMELSGARQSLDDASTMLDELRAIDDAASGVRLVGDIDQLIGSAASQLGDAATWTDGFDAWIGQSVKDARAAVETASAAWSALDASKPAAVHAAIDGTMELVDQASGKIGSVLDEFGI